MGSKAIFFKCWYQSSKSLLKLNYSGTCNFTLRSNIFAIIFEIKSVPPFMFVCTIFANFSYVSSYSWSLSFSRGGSFSSFLTPNFSLNSYSVFTCLLKFLLVLSSILFSFSSFYNLDSVSFVFSTNLYNSFKVLCFWHKKEKKKVNVCHSVNISYQQMDCSPTFKPWEPEIPCFFCNTLSWYPQRQCAHNDDHLYLSHNRWNLLLVQLVCKVDCWFAWWLFVLESIVETYQEFWP